MRGCKFTPFNGQSYGGQHTNGPAITGVVLTHPEFSIVIQMAEYRTQAENKAAAEAMFEFFLLSKNVK